MEVLFILYTVHGQTWPSGILPIFARTKDLSCKIYVSINWICSAASFKAAVIESYTEASVYNIYLFIAYSLTLVSLLYPLTCLWMKVLKTKNKTSKGLVLLEGVDRRREGKLAPWKTNKSPLPSNLSTWDKWRGVLTHLFLLGNFSLFRQVGL